MTPFNSDLILARLHGLHPRSIDLSLGRIERLLERLGNPERALPPVVHAAGTNGKGSVLAMLHAMLAAAGHRVHRYVSPHLVHFGERILIEGRPVDDALLADALIECERANGGAPVTFFEITTAAAFLLFARHPADMLLMETGLGGRLDATNVLERPALTALTPISLDHQSFLGDRLEQIAAEKAGILKPGVPCVVGPQRPAALAVMRTRAAEIGAPLIEHGLHWHADERDGCLLVRHGDETLELPMPALRGTHQIGNAGMAVVSARTLAAGSSDPETLAEGLRTTEWPARLQRLGSGRMATLMRPGDELWLDGGHNPAAGAALAASLADMTPMPLHLVVGMLTSKDEQGFLAPLATVAQSVCAVPVPGEAASRDPGTGVEVAMQLGLPAASCGSVAEAIAHIRDGANGPVRVLVCGSLYLAGTVLRENGWSQPTYQ